MTAAFRSLVLVAMAALFVTGIPAALAADPSGRCVLPAGSAEGPTDWSLHVRPTGTVKAIMIFVDFPDAPAQGTTARYVDLLAPGRGHFSTSSYGRLDLDITAVDGWFRMPQDSVDYDDFAGNLTWEGHREYIVDAVRAADLQVNFAGYDILYVVANEEADAISMSPAFHGINVKADGDTLETGSTLGNDIWVPGWGHKVLVHETGHVFGLPDLYAFTGGDIHRFAGGWDLMGDIGGHSPDFLAWHKWKLGWLDAAQVACITDVGTTQHILSPVETGGGLEGVVVRTSLHDAIVVENRTRSGVNGDSCDPGALIYRVSGGRDSDDGPIRVVDATPESTSPECERALDDATFSPGQSFVDAAAGVTIDVLEGSADDLLIKVTRTSEFIPPDVVHERNLSGVRKRIRTGGLVVKGSVVAANDHRPCTAAVPIKLQRRTSAWKTIASVRTDDTGDFAVRTRARSGRYRLKAPRVVLGSDPSDICAATAKIFRIG